MLFYFIFLNRFSLQIHMKEVMLQFKKIIKNEFSIQHLK